jgi:hypothetical protein
MDHPINIMEGKDNRLIDYSFKKNNNEIDYFFYLIQPSRLKKNRKKRGHVSAGHGRIGK